MKSTCRWVPGWGYYLKAHEITCRESDCVGCQPCTHEIDGPNKGKLAKHCTGRDHSDERRCTEHLDAAHPRTCVRCIGRTRKHLSEIDTWHYRDLYREALEAGVRSEAAMLAADAPGTAVIVEYDNHHPLSVLSRWDFMLREDYGLKPQRDAWGDEACTVASAASFLAGILDKVAQASDQDWSLFASEIAACHSHLANVLHIANRYEKGAPCPVCPDPPRLEKFYVNPEPASLVEHPDEALEERLERLTAGDLWWCSSCGARWSEDDYRQWVDVVYLEHADRLTGSQIAEILTVPEGTVRRWANEEPPRVRKRGYDGRRRQLYDVADVRAALALRTQKETA